MSGGVRGESRTERPLNATNADAQWEIVERLLHEALDREPSARAAFLDGACSDAVIRDDVDALLRAHDGHGMLDALAATVMQPLLGHDDRLADAARPGRSSDGVSRPVLERYRIIERLGGGGMGIVYRARDERLDRDVALKFLPPHLSADEAAKKRFLVEARAAASIEHPNICTVHEIGETNDGQLYIVMGCYDGATLDRRIANGPLPVDEAIRIALEIARGLAKAHERRIVHRDVKPANIMITGDGLVKILDFGIAKLADPAVTQAVGIIGTLAYMSPEQAFGEVVDARADVWALGVVLHEMLTGRRPFDGPDEQAILYAILTADLQPVDMAAPIAADVAPAIDRLLRQALARHPADRLQSAHELVAELTSLEAIVRNAGVSTSSVVRASNGVGTTASPRRGIVEPRPEPVLGLAGERRHAAVVVTGIAYRQAMAERLGPDEMNRVASAVREIATEVAVRHGGIVNHIVDTDLVLLFGVATSHEDDSLRAVRATLELHSRVRALQLAGSGKESVAMRSGVDAGPLVAQRQRTGDRRFNLTGAPVDVALGLAGHADDDEILLSPDAHRLVASFVESEPSHPLTLSAHQPSLTPHRITGESAVLSRLEIAERAGLTPFTGRSRELEALEELLAAAVAGDGGVAIVLGDPGAGKSRLLFELRRRVDRTETQLIIGRCDAYGGTTPYSPFVQALRDLLGIGGAAGAITGAEVAERVRAVDASLEDFLPLYCALLSVESAAHPLPRHLQGEHLQAAMLEALAGVITLQSRNRPILLLFEDWHWSDEASRRALEQLADIAPAHPLLIVVSSRTESGVQWSTTDRGSVIHLRPLSLEGSTEIISGVLGAERVAAELAQQLHERTGGNPFFLEESCHALMEQQLVVVRDGAAVAGEAMALMQLPETVQSVIRTRLDHLTPPTRDILRVASVIGREFTRAVLDELTDTTVHNNEGLAELRRTGLVQQTSVAPEPSYRFRHVLAQEVAYDTLLDQQRVSLHAKAAAAIERRYADRLDEHRERLAHHCSRAGQWRAATLHGIHSADRSHSLSQFADALAMLDRAREWAERIADDDQRRELLADVFFRQERLCETLGLRARQISIVEELIALLAPHGGSSRLAEAYLRQGDVFTLLGRFDAADRSLATALRLSRELGDRAGERNAARSFGLLRSHEGRYEEAVGTIEHALALDEELGETAGAAGDVASLGNVLRRMGRPRDAIEALEHARERLTRNDDPTKWCAVLTVMACAHRDLGDDAVALRYLKEVRDTAIERRLPIMASFSLPAIGHMQLQQGDVEEGLATYRQAAELSRRARHANGLAQALRALGEVLLGLGRVEAAVPHLREAADIFAQLEDRETETHLWQRLAAACEQCNRPAEAHEFWERVHDRCEGSGDSGGEAIALEGIARCARLRGVRDEAMALYERALRRAVTAGDREREATLRNTLGLLRWEDGSYGEALRQYEAALRLCRERKDRVHEGLSLNSLGATLLKLQRFDEARTVLEEAAALNASTGERRLEAHSWAVLGDSLLETGRISDARAAFERSLALRPTIGDRRGEGWMYERVARVLIGEGRLADAHTALERAKAIAAEIGDGALATSAGSTYL
jgi:tetratricopeptide (TPR) repeat protein/class 3 adenylate cyclase